MVFSVFINSYVGPNVQTSSDGSGRTNCTYCSYGFLEELTRGSNANVTFLGLILYILNGYSLLLPYDCGRSFLKLSSRLSLTSITWAFTTVLQLFVTVHIQENCKFASFHPICRNLGNRHRRLNRGWGGARGAHSIRERQAPPPTFSRS